MTPMAMRVVRRRRGKGFQFVLLSTSVLLLPLFVLWAGTTSAKPANHHHNHDDAAQTADDDTLSNLDDTQYYNDDHNNNDDDAQHDDPAWDWTDDNDRSKWSDLDQFTYSSERSWGPNIYPPNQWIQVGCFNQSGCLGWPETMEQKIGWEMTANHCIWCPAGVNNSANPHCHKHHNSPINLYREVALNESLTGNASISENTCIDVHWMHYEDSSCSFEALVEYDAFSIERHALQIKQPLEQLEDGTYRIACQIPQQGGRWGKIDFSRGFTQWWLLSHTDVKVPSEHTQNGKRYSAEIQMVHTYSIETDGTEFQTNELGTVSVFLEAYDDAPDFDVLNRLICQWRNVEDKTRAKCKLKSIKEEYPGCFYRRRNFTVNVPQPTNESLSSMLSGMRHRTRQRQRRLRRASKNDRESSDNDDLIDPFSSSNDDEIESDRTGSSKTMSAHDIFIENLIMSASDPDHKPKRIRLNENEFDNVHDMDWDEFIRSVYEEEEENAQRKSRSTVNNVDNAQGHRELLDYSYVTWNNYFAMLAVKTEYYYRYSGSMTIPPCYGRLRLGENNRYNTNNWRVMKDPIRVSQRQIDELHRLIQQRIAPYDDPIRPCKHDTAAAQDPMDPSKISVARPLQENKETHWMTFCECENWESKWKEDRAWCSLGNETQRFFEHPYNFNTSGF